MTTSRQALSTRLKKLELRQGKDKLGQWIIVGVRGQMPGESDQDYMAYRTAAAAEAREVAGWDGLVIEVPEGFERDPRDLSAPDQIRNKS